MARPQLVFFDVNETLLDLTPLKASVAEVLGGTTDSAVLWFTTLLQHSLVATVADRYHNFDELGAACLRMLAGRQGIELSKEDAERSLAPMHRLPPYGDVIPALQRLRDAGFRLAPLTNSSKAALADQMANSGLVGFFEVLLSVEDVGLYKPHPQVYRWGASQVGVDVSECLFVAAHGWDVAGASWAGMKTAFIARSGQQLFPLGPPIDVILPSFTGLPDALSKMI